MRGGALAVVAVLLAALALAALPRGAAASAVGAPRAAASVSKALPKKCKSKRYRMTRAGRKRCRKAVKPKPRPAPKPTHTAGGPHQTTRPPAAPAPTAPTAPPPPPTSPSAPTPSDPGATPPPSPPPPAAPARLGIRATEFALTLSRPSIPAGAALVEFDNTRAEDPHDLNIARLDGTGATTAFGELESGETATRDLTFTPGSYRLWCSLPGHETLGMSARLEVTGG